MTVDYADIAAAKTRHDNMRALHDVFLLHCKTHAVPQGIPSRLHVEADQINVAAFERMIVGSARYVRTQDNHFVVEYVFLTPNEAETIEVWRCYLHESGKLVADVNGRHPLCDLNDPEIAKQICGRVLHGALRSGLFAETPARG